MTRQNATLPSRGVIAAGLAALVAVLLLILLQDPPIAPPKAAPQNHKSSQIAHETAAAGRAEPAAVTPTTVEVAAPNGPLAQIAHVNLEPAERGALVPLDEVLAAPAELRGRLFACRNTLDALPMHWQPAAPNAEPDPVAQLLQRTGKDFAQYRLTLACRTANLRTVPVHVFFENATLSALPALGRDTEVALQLLGLGPAGHLLARYIHVAGHARGVLSKDLPDLLGALLAPRQMAEQRSTCLSRDVATLLLPAQVEPGELAQFAMPQARTFALLTCADQRGVGVPVLAAFADTQRDDVLRIASGTALTLRWKGAANNRLLAIHEKISQGGVVPAADDLRRVLLRPEAHVGQLLACNSQGLPLPQPLEPSDPQTLPDKGKLADRKAWLVCAQPSGPPMHFTLLFREGSQAHLLDIVRGTSLEVRAQGAAGDRILAVFERILEQPAGQAAQREDFRRFVLLGTQLQGEHLRCKLARDPELAGVPGQARPGARLFPGKVAERPSLLDCVDALRPYDGQRFEVYFPDENARKIAALHAGSVAELTFVGVVDATPVAGFLARQ